MTPETPDPPPVSPVAPEPPTETECCREPIAADERFCQKCGHEARIQPTGEPAPCVWRDIDSAPKVHPLNGGDSLLLAWIAPGVNEWITVVGCWRNGWWSGSEKAYPTLWAPVPQLPGHPLTVER